MKILICYFSGTGNTKRVVDKYVEAFKNKGCEVDTFRVENQNFEYNIEDYDKIGLAYPIHAFNAPSIIFDFIKKLPKLKEEKPLFIIKTSGEPLRLNNISSIKPMSILKKKNFKLTNEYHYCMPYNIIFRHTDSMAYKMWETAKKLIPIDVQEILDGKEVKLKKFPLGRPLAFVFRIEHWGGRFNGKRYKVKDSCVHCNACVNICPTHNITVENGEFHFGKKCIMCMRCAFLCQKNAIKIGLFEKWKVNGPYTFQKPDKEEENKHKKYCKKSYQKYFKRAEEKIKNAQKISAEEKDFSEEFEENSVVTAKNQ